MRCRTSIVSERKRDSYKVFAMSSSIEFLCIVSKIQKIDHSQHICPRVVSISIVWEKNVTVINFAKNRSSIVFRTPSRKFKILTIPNILAPWMLLKFGYEQNITVIKFTQSRGSISFLCTVSNIRDSE